MRVKGFTDMLDNHVNKKLQIFSNFLGTSSLGVTKNNKRLTYNKNNRTSI